MGDNLATLLIAASIAMATWGLGRPAARRLRLDRDGDLAMLAWSAGLGALAVTGLLWLSACFRCFTAEFLACGTLLAAIWGLWEYVCAFARPKAPVVVVLNDNTVQVPEMLPGARRQHTCTWALVGLCACASLIAALAPPTAPAVIARLEPAKSLVLAHGFSLGAEAFPGVTDVWLAWALALDGPVGANLVQWLFGLFVALATALLAQLLLGRRHAPLAAAVVLLTPGIQAQMIGPCDGLLCAAFAALAFSSWWLARTEPPKQRWSVLAGALAIAAVVSGQVAMPLLIGAAASAAYVDWRRKAGDFVVASSVAGLLVLGVAGLGLCCFGGLPDGWASARPTLLLATVASLGPLFVAALPALWICRRLRGLAPLLTICACSTLIGLAAFDRALWVVSLVPALAIAVVWVWLELDRLAESGRLAARLMLGALAVASVCPLITCAVGALAVASGYESREAYLLRECQDYELTLLASHFISEQYHLLTACEPAGYVACRVTTDGSLSRGLLAPATGSLSRQQKLRKMGFTHVLMTDPRAPGSTAAPSGHISPEEPRVQTRGAAIEIALESPRQGQGYRLLILR